MPRSSKSMRNIRRGSAIGGIGIQIDHLHFVEDFRKDLFLKQMDLEKNRMQTDIRMDQIRKELSQLHCQSQEFLMDVEKLDRDIENERSRRLFEHMRASNDQLYANDSPPASPEFLRPPSYDRCCSELDLTRPITSFSDGMRVSSDSDFEDTDEEFKDDYTFQRRIKYKSERPKSERPMSERPKRSIACNLMTVATVESSSFSEQVFSIVRDTITTI